MFARRGPWAALLLALFAAPASAVYRCGNTFQDLPCSNGEKEVRLGPSGRPVSSPATASTPAATGAADSPFAAACSRAGQDAQRVAWKREAGATQERQAAELPNSGDREEMLKIITSVYSRRGNAAEMRTAIESECLVEKKKQADAAATLRALTEQAGMKGSMATGAGTPPTSNAVIGAQGPSTTAPVAADPRLACPGLRAQDEELKANTRKVGSAATMESYNEQRRRLNKALLDAKC